MHTGAQSRAARRRVGAEVAGEPRDGVEDLREAASRRRAAYLVHRPGFARVVDSSLSSCFLLRRLLLLLLLLPACFCLLLPREPQCIRQLALLPFWGYRLLPARDRLDTDARGAATAHPRHFVTSHARTVIVDRDTGLALRPVQKKEVFLFFSKKYYICIMGDGDKVYTVESTVS